MAAARTVVLAALVVVVEAFVLQGVLLAGVDLVKEAAVVPWDSSAAPLLLLVLLRSLSLQWLLRAAVVHFLDYLW